MEPDGDSRDRSRLPPSSMDLDWLRANQCHSDTSATVTPVPDRHGYPCHSDTPPVPQRYQYHRGTGTSTTLVLPLLSVCSRLPPSSMEGRQVE